MIRDGVPGLEVASPDDLLARPEEVEQERDRAVRQERLSRAPRASVEGSWGSAVSHLEQQRPMPHVLRAFRPWATEATPGPWRESKLVRWEVALSSLSARVREVDMDRLGIAEGLVREVRGGIDPMTALDQDA